MPRVSDAAERQARLRLAYALNQELEARKISQAELTAAIERHAVWVDDRDRGTRAAFENCDLTGLDFCSEQGTLVNLRGSDFTGADLTDVTGRDVSFLWASLQNARDRTSVV